MLCGRLWDRLPYYLQVDDVEMFVPASPFCPKCLTSIIRWSATGEVEVRIPVPEHEYYMVSSFGEVRSQERVVVDKGGKTRRYKGQLLKRGLSRGYPHVMLCNGRRVSRRIHVIEVLAFYGPRPTSMEACHYDDVKIDNRLCQLRYDTRGANQLDRVRNGNHHEARKTHCKYGHEFTPENTRIDSNGGRCCRECQRAYHLQIRERKRERERQNRDTINARRRAHYRANRDTINARKRELSALKRGSV